jgi:uncharacterized protein (TIGR00297 family)
MDFLTLDWGGIALAVVLGVLFLFFGLNLGAFFLLAMLVFLILSAVVTYIDLKYKKALGIGQAPRSFRNVLANGLPPLVMAAIFYVSSITGSETFALLSLIGFLASIAAITADKFNSEIGVLSRDKPRMIFTLKKVKKGTSGAISPLGTFAGVIAALMISLLVILIAPRLFLFASKYPFGFEKAIASITIAGFIGGTIDSVLGYYEEKGIGNKYTSNFLCGLVAGFLAMAIFVIL